MAIKDFFVKFTKIVIPSFLNWGVVISLLEFCALSFICRRLSDIESLGSRPFEGFLA